MPRRPRRRLGSTRSTCRSTRTSRPAATPRIPARAASLPDDRYLRILDPWVALSTAAAVTSTIRLGTAVALPMEHDPITLAKTLATLDHLSGGRVNLGVGFGWNVEELEDHGVPGKKRRTVLREYLELMQQLWTEEVASYDGEYASLKPSWAWPKPVQQPRIPILVGAGGTPKNFDWIVANADGWITTPIETDIEERVAALNTAWAEAGRRGRSPDRRTPDQSARARAARALGGDRRRRGDVRAPRQGA